MKYILYILFIIQPITLSLSVINNDVVWFVVSALTLPVIFTLALHIEFEKQKEL
jgi:hypothetical protein